MLLRNGGVRPPHVRKWRADQWTPAQAAQLERCVAAGQSYEAIAAEVGRTPGAVEEKAKRLGLQRPNARSAPRWTDDRTALLEQRWRANVRVPEIAAELGVSKSVIARKASFLGLSGRHAVLDHRRRSARIVPLAAV
jgi:hypothetical protein